MTGQPAPLDIVLRLNMAGCGACSCDTKSPEIAYHEERCLYRVVTEAVEIIEEARTFRDTRGRHDGEHVYDAGTDCSRCVAAYNKAEAALDAMIVEGSPPLPAPPPNRR